MIRRPDDTVATALIDAVVSGPLLDSGGVDRTAVECAAAVSSIADNLAADTYREHSGAVVPRDGAQLSALEEGRRILAVEGVAWLLDNGYLRTVGEHGLALSRVYQVRSGDGEYVPYIPGTYQEEGLFRQMRRPIPERIDLIRESIERLGDLREFFPVLEDEDGNVVDGRHRRALDPNWPAAERRVPRGKRVAAAVAANRTNAWTAEDWKRLKEHAEFVLGKALAAKELARLALLEDHERSNRSIADLVGCAEGTVRQARRELEKTAQITQFSGKGGRPKGSKDTKPRKSVNRAKQEAVAEAALGARPASEAKPSEPTPSTEDASPAPQPAFVPPEASAKPSPAVTSPVQPVTYEPVAEEPEPVTAGMDPRMVQRNVDVVRGAMRSMSSAECVDLVMQLCADLDDTARHDIAARLIAGDRVVFEPSRSRRD
jgi:hypothetical protein